MVSILFTVISNQLELSQYLAHRKEAKALGEDDSACDELGSISIPELVEEGRGLLLGCLGCRSNCLGNGLEELSGLSDQTPRGAVVGLYRCHGSFGKRGC